MMPRRRDVKVKLKRGEGETYLCDVPGCPKEGIPLSQDMAKNHRKTFKKYGVCLKQYLNLDVNAIPPSIKSKRGESIYPRACVNPNCPKGETFLTKTIYNYHKRNYDEFAVCMRD